MKFHWGHGIVTAGLIFICFISALVYRSMQEKVDFVTGNYYEKELKYQDHIDSEKNSLSLAENLKIDYRKVSGQVVFKYPGEIPAGKIEGKISFYRPDNSALDFSIAVKCGQEHAQEVSTVSMKRGVWKVMFPAP